MNYSDYKILKQSIFLNNLIFPIHSNLDELNQVDKDLNKEIADFLSKLSIDIENKDEFINNSNQYTTFNLLLAALEIRGLDKNWDNTLFSIKIAFDVKEEDLIQETINHYFTTYGKEFIEKLFGIKITLDVYIPNKDFRKEKLSINEIFKYYNKNIKSKVFENESITIKFEKFPDFKNLLENVLYNQNRSLKQFKEFFEYAIRNLKFSLEEDLPIYLDKIPFKENKILILDIASKNNKIEFFSYDIETALRFVVYSLTNNGYVPTQYNLIYTKWVRALESSTFDKEFLESMAKTLDRPFNKVLSYPEREKFYKLYKQHGKRKTINKIMRVVFSKRVENKEQYTIYNEWKKIKYNKGENFANTPYSYINYIKNVKSPNHFRRLLKHHPSILQEQFLRILDLLKIEEIVNEGGILEVLKAYDSLTLKSKVQLYNYLQALLKIHNEFNNDIEKYMYIHHSIYTTERKTKLTEDDVELIKFLVKEFKARILTYINEKLRKYLDDNKIQITEINWDIFKENIKYPYKVRSNEASIVYEFGTYFESEDSNIESIGIYWENYQGERVDLDLSALFIGDKNVYNIAWNTGYKLKNNEGDVIAFFTGDITDGKYGAAEYIIFDKKEILNRGYNYIIFGVTDYTHIKNTPYYIAKQNLKVDSLNEYVNENEEIFENRQAQKLFNPENVDLLIETSVNSSSQIIGIYDLESSKFYPLNTEFHIGQYGALSLYSKHISGLVSRLKVFEDSLSLKDVKDAFVELENNKVVIDNNEEKEIKELKIKNYLDLLNLVSYII